LSTKGIDNSILTSLRTLAKLNNSISDTFKVIHSKFAPSVTNNPCYAHKKEIPQAEKMYSVHPPLDLSMLADRNSGRSISMAPPPLKKVYKQMVKTGEFMSDLPSIRQTYSKRGFVGHAVIPNLPSNKYISEIDESQFTLTGRMDVELTSPPEVDSTVNYTALNTHHKQNKFPEGRGGGFKVIFKEKKGQKVDYKSTKKHIPNTSETNMQLSKEECTQILTEIGIGTNSIDSRHKKSNSMLPSNSSYKPGNVLQGNKNTVRGLIDQMYQREKKYIKQYFKEDYIQQNDFIFNLGKTHQLKLAKSKENSQQPTPQTEKAKMGYRKGMHVDGFN
jgi:hypothetical protein